MAIEHMMIALHVHRMYADDMLTISTLRQLCTDMSPVRSKFNLDISVLLLKLAKLFLEYCQIYGTKKTYLLGKIAILFEYI